VTDPLVTFVPDFVENAQKRDDLKAFLGSRPTLTDKSSIGKMRDSDTVQLFSLENCLNCRRAGGEEKELMSLLPWLSKKK
jgi:hypothetical protein